MQIAETLSSFSKFQLPRYPHPPAGPTSSHTVFVTHDAPRPKTNKQTNEKKCKNVCCYLASRGGKVHWRRGRRSSARGRRNRSIAACGSCRKASGNWDTNRWAAPTAVALMADSGGRSMRRCCRSNCCSTAGDWCAATPTMRPTTSVESSRSIYSRPQTV